VKGWQPFSHDGRLPSLQLTREGARGGPAHLLGSCD